MKNLNAGLFTDNASARYGGPKIGRLAELRSGRLD